MGMGEIKLNSFFLGMEGTIFVVAVLFSFSFFK